ncbi:hypothetical protein HPB51_003245 [Rhipicephalus microplus]|uniref:Uncharacterized protein n=1 Tax=Rhipicephalus microplus TaxID=6941 RepID=A0A9J6D8P3_RHIMP|nr:hypothetical protein HPB51_003245 [Rhipicephalus microplus]
MAEDITRTRYVHAHSSRFLVREENAARKGGRSLTRNETKRDTHDDSKQAGPLKEPSHTSRSCPCPPPRLRAASSCCASRGRPWRNRGESHHHGARCDITLVQKTGWHEYLCTLVPRECGTNFHAGLSATPRNRYGERGSVERKRRGEMFSSQRVRIARHASPLSGVYTSAEKKTHTETGCLCTRSFISHQRHARIGFIGAETVALAATVVQEAFSAWPKKKKKRIRLSQIDPASFFYCTACQCF